MDNQGTTKTNRDRAKASTLDILGGVRKSRPRVDPRWAKYYQQLLALRDHSLEQQHSLVEAGKEEQPTFSLHEADAGTDQFNSDFAFSLAASGQSAIYDIEAAIERIQNGTYGVCELSGEPIETERLEAVPWARFSSKAAKELEKDGKVPMTRFGARDTILHETGKEDDSEDDAA